MSMAIWAQYQLADGTIISDESDKYQMLEYMEALDMMCEELGLSPLSEMLDYTEALENFDDEFEELDDLDEMDHDTLQHLGKSGDEETLWVTPREAIYVIDTLLNTLSTSPEQLHAPAEHIKELLQEFEGCLGVAQEALDQDCECFRLQLLT